MKKFKSFLQAQAGAVVGIVLLFSYQSFAATAALKHSLTANGMNQGDLWQSIENLANVVNELQTDHATYKTLTDELHDDHATNRSEFLTITTTAADYKAIYDVHTHEAPGSDYAASRTSTPDTGAAENSLAASAASAFTDTTGSTAATLTAAKVATLTESTAIDLTP